MNMQQLQEQFEQTVRRLLNEHQETTTATLDNAVKQLKDASAAQYNELRAESQAFAAETRAATATTRADISLLRNELQTLRTQTETTFSQLRNEFADAAVHAPDPQAPLQLMFGPQQEFEEEVQSNHLAGTTTCNTRNRRFRDANIKVPPPEEFYGNKGDRTLSWVLAMEDYASDWGLQQDDCVPLARQLLRGDAKTWLQSYTRAVHEGRKPVLTAWNAFKHALLEEFPEPDSSLAASMKLLTPAVRQGTRPVRDYTAEMRGYFLDAGSAFNERTKINLYWAGLNKGLRAKVDQYTQEPGMTLERMVRLAHHYDERFEVGLELDRKIAAEKPRPNPNPRPTFVPRPTPAPLRSTTGSNSQPARSQQSSVNSPGPTPMQLGNVCSYCKPPGHPADKCWKAHPELRPRRFGDGGQRTRQSANRTGVRVHELSIEDSPEEVEDLPAADQENC